MRSALIKYNDIDAGVLTETVEGWYEFRYLEEYVIKYPELFITFNRPVRHEVYRSKHLTSNIQHLTSNI